MLYVICINKITPTTSTQVLWNIAIIDSELTKKATQIQLWQTMKGLVSLYPRTSTTR